MNLKFLEACARGDLEEVKLLVSQGAYIQTRNNMALKTAKHRKHIDIVNYLENQLLKQKLSNI